MLSMAPLPLGRKGRGGRCRPELARAAGPGYLVLVVPILGPIPTNLAPRSSHAIGLWSMSRRSAASPLPSQGCCPALILISACFPAGVGRPLHSSARPYALRAANAPHLRQNRMGMFPVVNASWCPFSAMARVHKFRFMPLQRSANCGAPSSWLSVSFRHLVHRHMPEA